MKFKSLDFFGTRAVFLAQNLGCLRQYSLLAGILVLLFDDHEHREDRNDVAEYHLEEVLADADNVEELELLGELRRKYDRRFLVSSPTRRETGRHPSDCWR